MDDGDDALSPRSTGGTTINLYELDGLTDLEYPTSPRDWNFPSPGQDDPYEEPTSKSSLPERRLGRNTTLRRQKPVGEDERILREPNMSMGPYGVIWYESVVTGPQNAFKRELKDMQHIITALMATSSRVALGDLASFIGWFWPLYGFAEVYFKAEEQVLYTAVERDKPLGNLLVESRRVTFQKKILRVFAAIVKTGNRLDHNLDVGRTVRQLKKAADKLCIMLLGYMQEQFKILPRMLLRMYKSQEGLKITQDFVRVFVKGPNPSVTVVMLSRWLKEDPFGHQHYMEWRYECLKTVTFFWYGVWEKQFDKRLRLVEYFSKKQKEHMACRGAADATVSSLGSLPTLGTFGDLYMNGEQNAPSY